jgi:predicted MPP superfamily phosphohydrolase
MEPVKKSSKQKYSHRIRDWERVSGYQDRKIIFSYGGVETVRYEIKSEVPGLGGTKIAFFSDLHCGSYISRNMEENIIRCINDLKADFVVFGGDVVAYSFHDKRSAAILKQCTARVAKLSIPGNWDHFKKSGLSPDDWERFYRRVGFIYLRNRSILLNGIHFYGIDDIRTGNPVFEPGVESEYSILLAHNPDTVIYIGRMENLNKFDLAVCGHTHGGQIRFPGLGALITSSRYWRKFDYGRFKHRSAGNDMIISSGIGASSFPWRFKCNPEVLLIEFV